MVWMNGLEPTTPCMSSKCSNQLSYTHISCLVYTKKKRLSTPFFKFFVH